ncbi:aminoglycoside phosphotransferase family protein [Nonomuraea aurantiaca]|uniref:aminoglycoside phosphotransferase family protein n=1 Tax=Nonomuraea aurantiaca TaxID=2878562 RepID=UPI001CD9D6FA|nr:aminoglycoside phosphotransferase family protein [Nonomuraea aurantiaca]MCA2229951.1 aminoglycoside phosphotransferase family protein [Nonomuraea aurantiaca]
MTVFQSAAVPFTSHEAHATLRDACRVAGLASDDARLIRLGENALFVLAVERVVVRIARSVDVLDDARKEVAVSAWLHEAGLPAARTTHHAQPLIVRDRPVTFWHFIENDGGSAALVDLAEVLRVLHQLSVPADLALPEIDILGRVAERISSTEVLSDEERRFLLRKERELRTAYEALNFPLAACAVHGDAHSDNLIKATDGTMVLIDLERFAFGPPETDLAVTAIEHSLGWGTCAEYDQFAERYGFDVLTWEGYPVLRDINELKMTTWLMQNVSEDEAIADEFRNRLFCLQNPDVPRQWRAF